MNDLRKQFLRGYVLALMEDGVVKLSDGADAVILQIMADLREVLVNLANGAAVSLVQKHANKIAVKLNDPVAGAAIQFGAGKLKEILEKDGLLGLWNKLKAHVPVPKKKTKIGDEGLEALVHLNRAKR